MQNVLFYVIIFYLQALLGFNALTAASLKRSAFPFIFFPFFLNNQYIQTHNHFLSYVCHAFSAGPLSPEIVNL